MINGFFPPEFSTLFPEQNRKGGKLEICARVGQLIIRFGPLREELIPEWYDEKLCFKMKTFFYTQQMGQHVSRNRATNAVVVI